ncbi:septum formation initiator family protein, partial [Actinotalea sp. AC32]|nr:septum formation initiator family protein [Actinotalea sp. AC32]
PGRTAASKPPAAPPPRAVERDDAGEAAPARLVRLLSVRALVLGVVGLIAFTLLFPSVRAYLGQRAELDALEAEVAAARATEEDLRAELDRWREPAYVQAQARDRLSYVFPGETAYRVIDPEVVVETPVVEGSTTPETGAALPIGGSGTPWYTTIWDSIEIAGTVEPPEEDG